VHRPVPVAHFVATPLDALAMPDFIDILNETNDVP